jgi:hypothetical protein
VTERISINELTSDQLDGLYAERDTADAAWGSVWLHGDWRWLTKNMTTEQREHVADAVARWHAALYADYADYPGVRPPDDAELRWWRF